MSKDKKTLGDTLEFILDDMAKEFVPQKGWFIDLLVFIFVIICLGMFFYFFFK